MPPPTEIHTSGSPLRAMEARLGQKKKITAENIDVMKKNPVIHYNYKYSSRNIGKTRDVFGVHNSQFWLLHFS